MGQVWVVRVEHAVACGAATAGQLTSGREWPSPTLLESARGCEPPAAASAMWLVCTATNGAVQHCAPALCCEGGGLAARVCGSGRARERSILAAAEGRPGREC